MQFRVPVKLQSLKIVGSAEDGRHLLLQNSKNNIFKFNSKPWCVLIFVPCLFRVHFSALHNLRPAWYLCDFCSVLCHAFLLKSFLKSVTEILTRLSCVALQMFIARHALLRVGISLGARSIWNAHLVNLERDESSQFGRRPLTISMISMVFMVSMVSSVFIVPRVSKVSKGFQACYGFYGFQGFYGFWVRHRSILQDCPRTLSSRGVLQNCDRESGLQGCMARVPHRSV